MLYLIGSSRIPYTYIQDVYSHRQLQDQRYNGTCSSPIQMKNKLSITHELKEIFDQSVLKVMACV